MDATGALVAFALPELTSCANAACAAYKQVNGDHDSKVKIEVVPVLPVPSLVSLPPHPSSSGLLPCRFREYNVQHCPYAADRFHGVVVTVHRLQCKYRSTCKGTFSWRPSIRS